MSRTAICISATLFGFAAIAAPALAQKGTGESSGVARQGLKLPIKAMSGNIEAIKIGRCEKTTGRADEGAHLIVQMPDAKINLHLGPTFALRDELKQLSVGQNISFEAFRTDRVPKDAYIAKSIKAGDKVFALRNDSLRPIWARGRGGGGLPVARGGGICWW
ncbi:hypothetical protein JDN40_04035 [Rhodomicrobium vannielii ATCC 17100]|uniref:hypothetical protein n=1 Tax=Rhodomicrobium vannielii TaxID=1069 RepID=UPI00191B499B|nr:hypothetical protein [Rhodomicrobium vannielii]MBJ7533276.1 hypothetical protein [Rhodomicrobium vannielii ATCC 17100]